MAGPVMNWRCINQIIGTVTVPRKGERSKALAGRAPFLISNLCRRHETHVTRHHHCVHKTNEKSR